MSIAEQMLPEFDDEMARTRKVLAAIPANKMDWQPHEKLHTIGWNANHLAEIPSWIGGTLQSSEFDIAPVDGPAYTGLTLTDPAAILEAFDRNVAEGRAQLAAASDEILGEDWTMKMGGQPLFTIKKGGCVRKWVLNHSVHHRAILSILLRMQGVELMPVYDE